MKKNSRNFLAVVLAISLLGAGNFAVARPAPPHRRPNIVLIVSDDMGYADIGVHGSKDIRTPNIDALAHSGIRFMDAYVSGPYCSPTRAGLMTGRYPQRFGYEFNLEASAIHNALGLPLDETTIADRLRAAGYRTAMFGKWHLGVGEKYHPLSRGFDEFFGFLRGEHSYVDPGRATPNPLLEGRTAVTETTYLTDALTDRAVDFINRQKSQPFFLYLAFNAPHTPLETTDKYTARFPNIANERRRAYAALVSAMDDGVGRTVAALQSAGIEEETLIIFLNDNGGPMLADPRFNGASNAPLRGSKTQTWEGGIRVAFIVRWKGHLAEGKTDSRPIIQLDVLPTALAAAGVKAQPQWKLDGVDLLPYLTGKRSGQPHDALYWRLGENVGIRKGNWKLAHNGAGPVHFVEPATFNYFSGAELFDLSSDIAEKTNLAAAQPKKVKELKAAWQKWNRELAKPAWVPGLRLQPAPVKQ